MKRTIDRKILYSILIGFLLICTSFIGLGTVTITDNGIVDDTIGTVIDFTNDWVSLNNGTFASSINVDGRELDTVDFNAWDAGGTGDGYLLNGTVQNTNGNTFLFTNAGIQDAINDLNNESGTVLLPEGLVNITTPLQPWDNIEIRGAGMYSTILKVDNGFADPHNYNAVFKLRYQNTPRNVSICDLTVHGNSTYRGINAATLINGTFRNLRFIDCGNGADVIQFRENCSDLILNNIQFFNVISFQALYFEYCHYAVVNNILVNTGSGAGNQAIAMNWCDNLSFNNININSTTLGVKITADCENIELNNVNMHNIGGDGLKIQTSTKITVNNLHIDTTTANNGIVIDNTDYCTITNFIVEDATNVGVHVTDSSGSNSFIMFMNGVIKDAGSWGFDIDNSNNVSMVNVKVINPGAGAENNYCLDSEFLSFIGCTFTDGTYGLLFQNCDFVTVDACDIMYNSIDGVETGGGAANSYLMFSDCKIIGNTKGMDIEGDNNVTITGCMFKDNSGDGIECDAVDSVIIVDCIMWGDSFDDNIVGSHNRTGADLNIGMVTI